MLRYLAAVLLLVTLAATNAGAQRHFPADDEIRALARRAVPVGGKSGVVVGVIEPDGSRRVVAVADVPYDGGTLFEIGSITKTFTGILLGEMVERGEVRLEDPLQDLLPKGTIVPARNGRAIRLIDLATHASGLPRMPDNFAPADPRNPYADYTDERLYAFLRGHQLTRDIGEQVEYSNLGAGLLAHALTVRAGTSYEALVGERILQPLGMTSTRVVLRPEDRTRLAPGHSASGEEVANWDLAVLAGAGALRSSVDDMLTFVAANINPPGGPLGRAIVASHRPRARMNETAQVGLHWIVTSTRFGRTMIWHNGGTAGYRTFAGFDPDRRIGVVVLSNRNNGVDRIGRHLLDPREPVSLAGISRGFHILPLVLALLLIAGTFVAWRRTGASRVRATVVATGMTIALLVWMGGTYVLAASGLLRFDTRPPTFMLLVVALVIVSVGVGVSRVGRRLAAGLPLWILVGSQAFRLPLELLMHEAYEAGLMPVQMSFSGLNYDILTGISAIVVALLVAIGRAGLRTVRAWNLLGVILLCNIVTVALLSTPTPLRVFHNPPPNTWVASAPYVWLPSVMVAFAIVGHIVVYRHLRAAAGR
jgi:D-alanyl-D-alanine-carboxypeptidase/D-alanyl-D-alanine-endopeptidase